jgi:hypothetical protein
MAKSLNIAAWRKLTPTEMVGLYGSKEKGKGKKRKPIRSGFLIVRTQLRPVDVYAYLRTRFGIPNGPQNLFRKDDSDNWIHWDFSLKSDDVTVYIAGTSRDIHFMIGEEMTDQEWKELIIGLKADFGRIGHEKSAMIRSFEKFVVFQNKYDTLADLCAEMHESITNAPPAQTTLPEITTKRSLKRYTADVKRLSKRATGLYGDCLKLRLLTPIMAEAFINMVILVFCKDEVRSDPVLYEEFIRSKLPDRLAALSENCAGFTGPIDQTTEVYGNFKRVMDKRNFAIHGNIDPVREQIETVYFEGKRPLFADSGDNVLKLFEHLETINSPEEVIADYEAVHLFLVEIMDHLDSRHRFFFDQVIDDPYPGYELNKKRVTKILPNHNMRALMPRLRHDDDLDVTW